ncbi:hypothetical protein [Gordonia terrae]|nr:hypothetical protein [Gordonia terrae]
MARALADWNDVWNACPRDADLDDDEPGWTATGLFLTLGFGPR